jgi:hypothetical protein
LPQSHSLESVGFNNTSAVLESSTTGDTISIRRVNSSSYTDSDNKFGDVTVYYDVSDKKWKATGECDSPDDVCNRTFVNDYGTQVFVGRSRWLTYIVPISTNQILVFNST